MTIRVTRWTTLPSVLLLIALSTGCDSAETELINSIPLDEIEQVGAPTYVELETAFNTVASRNPELLQDSPAFARAVFDEVRGLKENGSSASVQARKLSSDLLRLTLEEWIVVLSDPYLTYLARDTPNVAREAGQTVFPCDSELDIPFNDGKADAVRHAYWNALIAKRVAAEFGVEEGLRYAEELATAHESESTSSTLDRRRRDMDLNNNAAGRAVFAANTQASDSQLLQLIHSLRFDFVEENQSITFDSSRLVYFDGRAEFDITMTGTLTNPKSGGPWDATFTFSQCGSSLLGGFTIVRGESLQERRFNGSVDGGSVEINISDPFVYENPDGRPFCANMQGQLSGSSASLSGTWVSSNCPIGGVINLIQNSP